MYSFFDAWREVAHISEWTGLSIGVLVALAAFVYLNPTLLRLAIKIAIGVVIAYACLVYGDHVGTADKQAEWTAANDKADTAATNRDKQTLAAIEAKYTPQIATLTKQSADLKQQVAAYEKQLLAAKASPGNGSCQLGASALRLRAGR